jgi:hypothetical protein
MLYAVCTDCAFLRAFGRDARRSALLERCPVCDGELVLQERGRRFEPTYVSRIALDLHAEPPLERFDPPGRSPESGSR